MAARKLLADVGHALRAFLGPPPDGEDLEIEAWDRVAYFQLDRPVTHIWEGLACEESPPKAYLLMARQREDDPVYELLWAAGGGEDTWPVVEVDASGEAQVLAANAEDWLDALLFTGGALGGGAEEDLADARDEASSDALDLARQLLDELDRDEADVETMGERWDEAQETWSDAWMDAVEGIEA